MRIKHKPPSIIQDLIDTSKIMPLKQENDKSIRVYINSSYKYSLILKQRDLLHESKREIQKCKDYKHFLIPNPRRGEKENLSKMKLGLRIQSMLQESNPLKILL